MLAFEEEYPNTNKCSNCGALISADSEFCPECGIKQSSANNEASSAGWFYQAGSLDGSPSEVVEDQKIVVDNSGAIPESNEEEHGIDMTHGADSSSWFVEAGNLEDEKSGKKRTPKENRCQKCGRVILAGETMCYSCAESERKKEISPPEENYCVKCGRKIPKGEVLCYACDEETKKQSHRQSFFEKYKKKALGAAAACFIIVLAILLVNPNKTSHVPMQESNVSPVENSGSSNMIGTDKTTTEGGNKDKTDFIKNKEEANLALSSEPSKVESSTSEVSEKENAGKESSVVIDDVTTIEITWDGRYKNGNLQKLTPIFTGSDTDDIDKYVKVVSKENGQIIVTIEDYNGIINFAVEDDGERVTEVDTFATIRDSSVKAKVTLADGEEYTYDLETGLYKSYTGYWFWAPFAINNGRITDYDSSWLDVSWEAPESAPESTPKPTKSPESAVFSAGRYVCYDHDGYLAADLTINKDGTFCMTVNLFEGYGTIKGTCELVSSGNYYCVVDDRDFYGFIGDDVNSFSLVMADDGSGDLIADGFHMIGMLQSGNVLEKVN